MRKSMIQRAADISALILSVVTATALTGCGAKELTAEPQLSDETVAAESESDSMQDAAGAEETIEITDPIAQESGEDGIIDFEALQNQNPDIFAWIYIPDAGVDQPILQNADEEDTYYAEHDAYNSPGGSAAYVEYPNRTDFCDFNEIIYEVDGDYIHSLANPDIFESAGDIEIFIDGNHMTYEVVMARKWERVDLLTQYAFPSPEDAGNFLRDCKDTMSLADNISSAFDEVTSDDFIITLVAHYDDDPKSQFMVIARLIKDEQGTIKSPQGEIPGVTF